MEKYYIILGLKTDATKAEIKIAYRKLSKKFHPDLNQGDKFFEERFKEIQEAYENLNSADNNFSNPNEKKAKNNDFSDKNNEANNSKSEYQEKESHNTNQNINAESNRKKSKYNKIFITVIIFILLGVIKVALQKSVENYENEKLINKTFPRINTEKILSNEKDEVNEFRSDSIQTNIITQSLTESVNNSKDNFVNSDTIKNNNLNFSEKRLTDIDGNSYAIVKIGEQLWLSENLKVSRFNNGDFIKEVTSNEEWESYGDNKIPAWCYFQNESENGKKYGKLYNLWAAIDKRGLAPEGWIVPRNEDCIILADLFGGFKKAGKHLKSTNFNGNGGTNNSDFNAQFVGSRSCNGEFVWGEQSQNYWTTTTGSGWGGVGSISANILGIYSKRDWGGICGSALMCQGFSIRCIKK